MGNAMGGGSRKRRTIKVMKMDGETFKLATPITASQILIDHPDHHLFESQSLTNLGLQAPPLEPHHQLRPKSLYFLLHLPARGLQRAHSALHVSAAHRLESLMLSRRSNSELHVDRRREPSAGPAQVKFRLPRVAVERLVEECKDEAEVAERIVDLYVGDGFCGGGHDGEVRLRNTAEASTGKAREKRVSFVQMKESSTQ